MAQVALAWVLRNPAICAPIAGATRPHQLPGAVAALDLKLTGDEVALLESLTATAVRPGTKASSKS
jgi:1-deoxyxylulose-5-phosphate synthase